MPREQINTPARRTVSTPTGSNGLKPGEYGIHFAQDGEALHDGQHREDTPVLMVGWHKESSHGPTPDEPGCVQFHLLVAADEVLRAAGVVRTNSVLAFGHPEPILNAIRADVGAGFVFGGYI